MSRLYRWFVAASRRWFAGMIVLFAVTFCFTWYGMCQLAKQKADGQASASVDFDIEPTWHNALYESIRLFLLDSDVSQYSDHSPQLSVARWTGAVGWFFTVASVLVRLFRQRALSAYVWLMTRRRPGHVIFAGLGPPEEGRERLAIRLCNLGRDV